MRKRLEAYFEFARLRTNWRTEILAGATTFLTMAYIVLVNPAVLHDADVPRAAQLLRAPAALTSNGRHLTMHTCP